MTYTVWKCEICGTYENVRHLFLGGCYGICICTKHLRQHEDWFDNNKEAQDLRKIILQYGVLIDKDIELDTETFVKYFDVRQVAHIKYKKLISDWVKNRKNDWKSRYRT